MKILKKPQQNLYYLLFSALTGAWMLLPKFVLAAEDPGVTNCKNFKALFNGVFSWVPDSYCTASGLALFAIKTLISFSGVVAVLFLIVGGFFYLTSAGNEEQIEKGKKIIINSVIGLVVVMLAYAIVRIIGGLITSGG